MNIGLTGVDAVEAESRDRLAAKDADIERLRAGLQEIADHYDDTPLAAKHMAAIARRVLRGGAERGAESMKRSNLEQVALWVVIGYFAGPVIIAAIIGLAALVVWIF